jgi:hypothetical protein
MATRAGLAQLVRDFLYLGTFLIAFSRFRGR